MAHNLFGSRFYQDRNEPAWHGLGINSVEPMTATQALERIGTYNVELRPLSITLPDGNTMTSDYQHIIRHPTRDDPFHRVFGQPVKQYELITPIQAVTMADENVLDSDNKPVPVSTLGVLNNGDRLFISYKLPTLDVQGDEVEMYLLYDNPMYSGRAAGVYTTGVRVVCQNTLTLGIGSSKQQKTITHLPGSSKHIAGWLRQIYGTALMTVEVAREAYNILAQKHVEAEQVKWIAGTIYNIPDRPNPDKVRGDYADSLVNWEKICEQQETLQKTVYALWDGMGTGMQTKACAGTLFGAYNAVAELETYRKTSNVASAAMDCVGGIRAARISKAFEVCLGLAKVN